MDGGFFYYYNYYFTCALVHMVQPQLVLVTHANPLAHVLGTGYPW